MGNFENFSRVHAETVYTAQTMGNFENFSRVHATQHVELSCFVQNTCFVLSMYAVCTYMCWSTQQIAL